MFVIGLSALLDREVLTPPLPDSQLVDPSIAISSDDLQFENPKTLLEVNCNTCIHTFDNHSQNNDTTEAKLCFIQLISG